MSTERSTDDEAYEAEMAVVEALVEKAMQPYRRLLSPPQLAEMREHLVEVLATHPNAAQLVAQLAKRAPVEVSGEVGGDAEAARGDDREAAGGEAGGRSGKT